MSQTPTFKNPPVVEFVLGVQFSRLTKLSSAHYGRLWDALGADWELPKDESSIPDQFELFDQPARVMRGGPRLKFSPHAEVGRCILHHRNKDRLIQIQPTRFHLNWRKTDELKPSYKDLIREFEEMFDKFRAFVAKEQLGDLSPNQWEVTYVDSFLQGEEWNSPEDWSRFLPGLFGQLFAYQGVRLEQRAAEWSFEIEPKLGRFHVAARMGRWHNQPADTLLLNMTARGPIGKQGVATLREGLDIGHEVSVNCFLKMVARETQAKWGVMP